jgi:hypothetical protein
MKLTMVQEKAHSMPCFLAEETQNPRFKHYEEHRECLISVILTANIGQE